MLSIKNLTKIYKTKGGEDTRALDDLTVSFPEKGMIFLLGKSGSGKSTLLNVAGGLDYPTSGEIILKGRSSKDFSQSDFDSYRNTYIGFIFQEYNVLNEFNVEQNIALALELQGKKASKEAVENLLEQVDLKGYGKRKPNTLSGGQKQRIAIARALIKEPNIIMADEPTGALDSKTGEQVFETLKKLSADKLVIVVSHDRDFAKRFGDRIIELKDGKIISDQTKHQIEAKQISENVSIINDKAIRINDAKKLTKADFDKLYNEIIKNEGKVFISSGENAVKSMKVARISDDGRSDEFKRTESVKLRVYDGSQTKFIRSKMPANKSVKMGLSSLKIKPVRLIFTILLSVISFTLFGVASSLMLYNSSHTYSDALMKTDYLAEVIQKRAFGKSVYQELDDDGAVTREWSYDSEQDALFGTQEISKFNENNLGLVYIPIGRLDTSPSFTELSLTKDAKYYGKYYDIQYISDASESDFKKLGYKLDGIYPVNDDEILMPKIFGEMLIDSEAVNKTTYPNYTSLVGETFKITFGKGSKNMKITGFFDAGEVPERYAELKKENSDLSPKELEKLSSDLDDFMRGSFNSVVFTNSNAFDAYSSRSGGNYRYVEPYRRAGLWIDRYDMSGQEVTIDNNSLDAYTPEIVKENADYFVIYDNDGNVVDNQTLVMSGNEIYLSEYRYEEFAYGTRKDFLENFINMGSYSDYMRYMPTYYEYYSNNESEVRSYYNYLYNGNTELVVQFYNQFAQEYERAYMLQNFLGPYVGTVNYYNLSESNRNLIESVRNADMGVNTSEDVNQVYNILSANFDSDDACKYYFPYMYLNDMYYMYCTPDSQQHIDNNSEIRLLVDKRWDEWNDNDSNRAINFLDQYYDNDITIERGWNAIRRGYTFATFDPVPDRVFEKDSNLNYNYKDYNGNQGSLTVKGYWKDENGNGYPIMSKSFLDNHSVARKDGGTRTRNYFISDYVAPEDARYSNVMVKTEYTQGQVAYMMKNNVPGCKYELTSSRYYTVNYIVELISLLKNIFLYTAIGFGVFAALMLLNFISVSVSSKKRDIGILRAIGARKSDVFKIFFAESLFIAAICAVLSIIGAFVVQFFLDRSFVDEIGISILQFNVITVGLVVGVALVVALLATIFPVISASRKPPVESIRAL